MPETISIDRLAIDRENRNRGTARGRRAVKESLEAFGAGRSVLLDKHGQIIAGNQTVAAAIETGIDDVIVVETTGKELVAVKRTDLDLKERRGKARALAISDNHTSYLGYNPHLEQLAEDLRSGLQMPEGILTAAEIEEMLAASAEASASLDEELSGGGGLLEGADPDEIPEDAPARCAPGEIWKLGPHRLLVGDCREPLLVARLLDGVPVNVVVTSPPYASQRTYDQQSGFQPIPPDRYVDWFAAVQATIASHLAEDGSYFLNIKEHCEEGQRHLYVKDLTLAHVRRWGWRFVDEFCWRDTKNGVPGGWNNRFKDAWEPIFHFTKQSQIKFFPLANATESQNVFEYSPETSKADTGSGLLGSQKATPMHEGRARPSNVLEIAAASSGDHSAAYPVALPAWFIRAFSDPGDIIFDPFLGSGTTLIAASQEGRVARGCEISPKYADVILARWEAATGLTAHRLA